MRSTPRLVRAACREETGEVSNQNTLKEPSCSFCEKSRVRMAHHIQNPGVMEYPIRNHYVIHTLQVYKLGNQMSLATHLINIFELGKKNKNDSVEVV